MSCCNKNKDTLLILAAKHGHLSVVQTLLDHFGSEYWGGGGGTSLDHFGSEYLGTSLINAV